MDAKSIDRIYSEAAELASPSERQAYLGRACGDNHELRVQVERLLEVRDQAAAFLEQPVAFGTLDEPEITERPGNVIGPYKILEQIGEGGFGVVFMAEQTRPVRRKVALKVLKPGMDTRQVVARFEAERQALALMDHPNIARIFDGGQTCSERPYFVMELVRGIPITDYCDQNHLPVRERLELFVTVCQAVQHAHQKGIIHRDLKPSNIMVTMHDATPVVKVIDFGIAKATGHQLTEKTLFTNFAQMIGTPLYMSPEQAQMSGLDVDTRSDIYSLGVLLYELLTGTTPFDKERLGTAAFDEIRRIIREEEPAKPSTRISTLGPAASTASANRRSDPKALSRLFRGELDWIVMKALEKDRTRRYETAGSFAADVLRYLHDEPVQACPPSTAYRIKKFSRRHRGPVLAASLVALALVGGIIGTSWGLFRATQARATAVHEAAEKTRALGDKEYALGEKVAALAVAQQSERDAQEQLFQSLLSQARAARSSGRVGQRFEALKAIRQAAEWSITPELRAEAAAALVLPDVELAHEWEGWPEDTVGLSFNAALDHYARIDMAGGVTVCRLNDGREEVIHRLPAHGNPRFGGSLMSPDGRFVACGHSWEQESRFGGVTVWKLDGPAPTLVPLEEPTSLHESAWAFDAGGRQLAIGHGDNSVSIYDLTTGRRMHRLALGAAPFNLAFHPRKSHLAIAVGNALQIFDTETAKELPGVPYPSPFGAHSVAWHPGGRRLAVGCSDFKIRIWDTETATEVMTPWAGHTNGGIVVAYSHGGDRLVSTDWDGQTRLWDALSGRPLLTMASNIGRHFAPEDRLVGFGRSGKTIRLWRFAIGRELRVLRRRLGDPLESIGSPAVHADCRTVVAGTDYCLNFFDLVSGEELASVRLPLLWSALPVSFEPVRPSRDAQQGEKGEVSGSWLTGGYSGLLSWPVRPDPDRPAVLKVGPPQQLAPGLESAVNAATSGDGRVVALPQRDSTVLLHRDRPDRRVALGPQFDVRSAAVSPDGRLVVTCSHWSDGSESARIWDAESGQQIHKLPLEGQTGARFSPDGRWLATIHASGTQLWEVGTWREGRKFDNGRVAFSPDGRLMAISDLFSVIRLVEIATGRDVARLTGPEPTWYHPECFTPDGTRLIASCTGLTGLYVWDLRLIRQQLKELGLDWDWPEFPPANPNTERTGAMAIEVELRSSSDPVLTREQKAHANIERYRRAFEANPEDANACNNLAWGYLIAPDSLRDKEAAVPLAEKAVRLDPKNPMYVNTLGLAYYRAGRFRDAVAALRPNLELHQDAGLPYDLYVLAMAHHRLGEPERARDYFDWAVRWMGTQRDLSVPYLPELTVIRAEAEELLGVNGEPVVEGQSRPPQ